MYFGYISSEKETTDNSVKNGEKARTGAEAPEEERVPYYRMPASEALEALGSSRHGLSNEEATRRLALCGPNVIQEERKEPLWRKFAANLTSFFAILLWIAAGLSFLIGSAE